jgi:hypothetical protein
MWLSSQVVARGNDVFGDEFGVKSCKRNLVLDVKRVEQIRNDFFRKL